MRHMVIDLEALNEPIGFAQEELGMCFLETNTRCYQALSSTIPPNMQLEFLPLPPANANEPCSIDVNTLSIDVTINEIWTLYYDGFKTKDGVGVVCILMDPKKYIL